MLTLFLNTTFEGTRIYLRGSSLPSGGGWIDPVGGGDFFYGGFASLHKNSKGDYKLQMTGVWGIDSLNGIPAQATVETNALKQVTSVVVAVRDASGNYVPVDLN